MDWVFGRLSKAASSAVATAAAIVVHVACC